MNGPQHYREAERLLAAAADTEDAVNPFLFAQMAQTHAMLAMTAAYAMCQPIERDGEGSHPSQEYYDEWVEAVEIGERDYEGVAFGGTTDPSIVSQQNAENAR